MAGLAVGALGCSSSGLALPRSMNGGMAGSGAGGNGMGGTDAGGTDAGSCDLGGTDASGTGAPDRRLGHRRYTFEDGCTHPGIRE